MGENASQKTDYFEPYSHFARALRIWFIAYGVGGPIAIFSNGAVLEKLIAAKTLRPAVWLFFTGMAIQVLMAIIWRTSMWYQYLTKVEANEALPRISLGLGAVLARDDPRPADSCRFRLGYRAGNRRGLCLDGPPNVPAPGAACITLAAAAFAMI